MRSGTLEHSEQYNEIKDLRGTLQRTLGTLRQSVDLLCDTQE